MSTRMFEQRAFDRADGMMRSLPGSWRRIEDIFRRPATRDVAALQFSLLMRFDELFDEHRHRSLRSRCIAMLEVYLRHIDRETGLAAWKAADFLADHVALSVSLPSIVRVMTYGRTWIGRSCAVCSVERAWEKADRGQRSVLRAAMKHVAKCDRSRRVRDAAKVSLRKLAGAGV